MPKLDRYLFREFAQSTFAALVVLMIVSLGGVFAATMSTADSQILSCAAAITAAPSDGHRAASAGSASGSGSSRSTVIVR